MGEFFVKGADALAFIQKITVNDASKLAPGKAQYSALPRPDGGLVDDLLVYMRGENDYMLVVNGANIDKDWAWVSQNAAGYNDLELTNHSDDINLLAVQGPKSIEVLQKLTSSPLADVPYYSFVVLR
jgi:aminomethyltransferase